MKKKTLSLALLVVSIAIASCGGVRAYKMYTQQAQSQLLLLSNIEALAEDNGDEGTEDYYLHHHHCEITASAKLAIIFNVKVGATIDLTDMTQYFNTIAADGEGPCNRGTDITCNDAVNQVMKNNS